MESPHLLYPFIHSLIGIWVVSTWAVMNNATMNIQVQTFMRTYIFMSLGMFTALIAFDFGGPVSFILKFQITLEHEIIART